jgi:hypothetical protein
LDVWFAVIFILVTHLALFSPFWFLTRVASVQSYLTSSHI